MVDRYWSDHLGRYVTAPDYDDDTALWQRRQEAILRNEGAPAPDEDEQSTYCASCLECDDTTPAVTTRNDLALCQDCADEFDFLMERLLDQFTATRTYRGYTIHGERFEVWKGRTRIGAAWTLEQAQRLVDAHLDR